MEIEDNIKANCRSLVKGTTSKRIEEGANQEWKEWFKLSADFILKTRDTE